MSNVNPITLEVVRNALVAYSDEMATVLCRTAYNMMIFEVRDYCVGIVDPDGNIISQNSGGLPIFLADLGAAVKGAIDTHGIESFKPGDVYISNDPAVCGQHLNNIVVFTPFFHEGKLVAFPASRAHWVDVGGGSRGFGSTSSHEIYNEGIQLCGVRAYAGGEPNTEVLRMIRDNIRYPDSSFGDLRAQIAGCRLGEKRLSELFTKYGAGTVQDCIHAIWDQSEKLAREAVKKIPDGTYQATAFIDSDLIDRNTNVHIKVKVVVEGDEMTIDFSDLPPQQRGPINSGESGGIAAARVAFKCLTSPNAVVNEGEMRPLKIVLPKGTMLSAVPPAPLGIWSISLPTVIDTILKAMSDVMPNNVAAAHKGDMGGLAMFGFDPDRKRNWIGLNIFGGGFGARSNGDGLDAVVAVTQGDVRNAPVEVQEAYYPLQVERHQLRENSGGAGKWRGGLGVEIVYKSDNVFHMNTHFQRTQLPPWGLFGGKDAMPMAAEVVRSNGDKVPGAVLDGLRINPGDKVVVRSAGGGGYGNPLERDPELVLTDVIDGVVTVEAAKSDYGVVIKPDLSGVDAAATAKLRKSA